MNTPTLTVGYYNDLWKYDPVNDRWTWMSGANTFNSQGNYGTKGVAAPTNQPRARGGSYGGGYASSWVDNAGNFWIFGGYGYNATNTPLGALNDLWRYNPNTNQWTWMGGTSNTNQPGTYGPQGTPSALSEPGSRHSAACWTDASGRFWMFGGVGYGANATEGYLNDLWMYDPGTNLWTWIGGSSVVDQIGNYGTRGGAAPGNWPGGRSSMNCPAWVDINGKFWIYGGYGYRNTNVRTYLADLWCYDPGTGMWTWMKGDPNAMPFPPVYGTRGVSDPANTPGSRYIYTGWKDLTGNFWLFGGILVQVVNGGSSGINSNGQLWRLHQVVPPLPGTPVYSAAPNACAGDNNVTYSVNPVQNATSYEWSYSGTGVTFGGGNTTTVPTNTLSFAPNATSGILTVRGVNAVGPGPNKDTFITVSPSPEVDLGPDVEACAGQSVTLQSTIPAPGGAQYLWSTGATTTTTTVNQSGDYWLEVTSNGCKGRDTVHVEFINITVDLGPDLSLCDRDAPVVLTAVSRPTTTSSGAMVSPPRK